LQQQKHRTCRDALIQTEEEAKNPLCSPMFSPDSLLEDFPDSFLACAALDPLLDDSYLFHQRLTALGRPSRIKTYPNVPHGFVSFPTVILPDNLQLSVAINDSIQFLRSKLT
jgi:acetyl esterase